MGTDIDIQFEDCLKNGKLKKSSETKSIIQREIKAATDDLKTAKDGLNEKRWKWCTIQAYYSMFHTARALLFSEGYREKSHYCLRVAMEVLFVKSGKIKEKHIDAFQLAKTMRENADYEEDFSESGAKKLVKSASDFLKDAKKLLK